MITYDLSKFSFIIVMEQKPDGSRLNREGQVGGKAESVILKTAIDMFIEIGEGSKKRPVAGLVESSGPSGAESLFPTYMLEMCIYVPPNHLFTGNRIMPS